MLPLVFYAWYKVITSPEYRNAAPVFQEWVKAVQAEGGAATVWPFPDSNLGKPAARYSAAAYGALFNSGNIDSRATQQTAPSGPAENVWFWVLAPQNVADAAPQDVLDAWQKLENLVYTEADRFASKAGFPTLPQLEKWIIIALVLLGLILGGLGYLAFRKR